MEEVEGLKTNKYEVKKKDDEWFTLSIEQEFKKEVVDNMLKVFNEKNKQYNEWLENYEERKKEVMKDIDNQFEHIKQQLLNDISMTDEELLKKAREEIVKKQEFLKNFDEEKKKAKEQATQQLEQQRLYAENELKKNNEAIKLWSGALTND